MSIDAKHHDGWAPWLDNYPADVPATLRYPRMPLGWLLVRSARRYPDRTACWYYHTTWTYRELAEQAERVSSLLVRLGVQQGDRVGVLLPNCPEHLSSLYGIWMTGATVVSLSPMMVPEEIASLLAATRCRVVIVLDLLRSLVREADDLPETIVTVTLQKHMPWSQAAGYRWIRWRKAGFRKRRGAVPTVSLAAGLAQVEPRLPTFDVEPAAPALILPTGGTTGRPRAVVLSHGNLMANAWQLAYWAGRPMARETFLAVLPFFHSYGLSTCATCGVGVAATLILHHRFQPRQVLRLIERHRPTMFHAVPAMLVALNRELVRRPADLHSLKWCISGGSALDPAVAEEFAGPEAGPVTHVGPLDGRARPGWIGLPLPDTEARIVDADTGQQMLGPGEVGELIVRGPQVMQGYWQDPEETARAIRDGWLYTGDLATCDEDGFFRIVDRKKDLIITSGLNVYPSDVEGVLRQFPGVADAAVVGQPDALRGEVVKAVLVLAKGGKFSRKAFNRFVGQHLSAHKRPRIVEVQTGDLPRNFLGKVIRRRLRADAAGAQAARVEAEG
jgi:long-chain acyl-CoA synthetase